MAYVSKANLSDKDIRTLQPQEKQYRKAVGHPSQLYIWVNPKRHYSVYNIALVFAQNPKVSFFGSRSFYRKFGRYVNIDARPYVIVKPFGPTDFVYDINDTHGDNDMDKIIKSFDINSTTGDIEKSLVDKLAHRIYSRGIYIYFDAIRRDVVGKTMKFDNDFTISINRILDDNAKFVAMIRELAHIMLGHLGAMEIASFNKKRKKLVKYEVKAREVSKNAMEFEAESVSYIICYKYGLKPNSAEYLAKYIQDTLMVDTGLIIKVANAIETLFLDKNVPIGKVFVADEATKTFI